MTLSYLYGKLIKKLQGRCVINSDIDKTSVIGVSCNIVGSSMDRYSYCGHECQIVNCEIGSFCSISHHVFIGGAEHPLNWVSTSPVFQNTKHSGPTKRFAKFDLPKSKKTIIGNDVWIGQRAIIMQGVTIGNGAVVGSGAVVTKDVPSYAIVAGVPSKILRYRFDEITIARLQRSKWWTLSDEELQKHSEYMNNPIEFCNKLIVNGLMGGGSCRLSSSCTAFYLCQFDSNYRRVAA